MKPAGVQDRDRKAVEYLQSLRSLTHELERAMQAIAHNNLSELEESIESQQILSARLGELADDMCVPLEADPATSLPRLEDDLGQQIRSASASLQNLNLRYAALLKHSSRSLARMTSLFSSFQGHFQEASGPRLKHQTWSCQM
jgi:flagellar biosynthesis/type III secretory pathway chaperone